MLHNSRRLCRGQEKVVITVEVYKQIRKMRLEGMSQRQIAAELHISRNTVKKYWDGDKVPWERKDYSRERYLFILRVSVLLSTVAVWRKRGTSMRWSITFRCWKRKDERSFMPGRYRKHCRHTLPNGSGHRIYLLRSWLRFSAAAEMKSVKLL